ncbi:hypothetical protein HK096_002372, partial [Nowakowskiella sp. JEL0078]
MDDFKLEQNPSESSKSENSNETSAQSRRQSQDQIVISQRDRLASIGSILDDFTDEIENFSGIEEEKTRKMSIPKWVTSEGESPKKDLILSRIGKNDKNLDLEAEEFLRKIDQIVGSIDDITSENSFELNPETPKENENQKLSEKTSFIILNPLNQNL